MVYRYDEEYNGEVVAESKRDDLNSFLGLHYPSTDIPSQARALYEKNWIRLISDVAYTPAPLVPGVDSASSLVVPPASLPESNGRVWASHGFEALIKSGSSATAGVSCSA